MKNSDAVYYRTKEKRLAHSQLIAEMKRLIAEVSYKRYMARNNKVVSIDNSYALSEWAESKVSDDWNLPSVFCAVQCCECMVTLIAGLRYVNGLLVFWIYSTMIILEYWMHRP